LRVFLDTNVLISAFITRGLCADIFRIILAEHHLVLSEYILSEFEEVMRRKIDLPIENIKSILKYLRSFEIISDHTPSEAIEIRDKNDIFVLASALNGKCDILISGDKDLLEVKG
jgi:putative PIN family toxin of toxin-antitoxin system